MMKKSTSATSIPYCEDTNKTPLLNKPIVKYSEITELPKKSKKENIKEKVTVDPLDKSSTFYKEQDCALLNEEHMNSKDVKVGTITAIAFITIPFIFLVYDLLQLYYFTSTALMITSCFVNLFCLLIYLYSFTMIKEKQLIYHFSVVTMYFCFGALLVFCGLFNFLFILLDDESSMVFQFILNKLILA